jgi:twitching motility protein PilJ
MALKMPSLFGSERKKASDIEFDMPTTQVKMNQASQQDYDPLASVSIMDQLRSATTGSAAPGKLWVIGDLPVTKQFQTLGALIVLFLVFAGLMMFLDNRQSGQSAAASATATEMQMLSQRLARGSALAAQGQSTAFAAVKDSRDRFKADLEALVSGGTVRGVSLDATQDADKVKLLNQVRQSWTSPRIACLPTRRA